jgi:hypothetical protein
MKPGAHVASVGEKIVGASQAGLGQDLACSRKFRQGWPVLSKSVLSKDAPVCMGDPDIMQQNVDIARYMSRARAAACGPNGQRARFVCFMSIGRAALKVVHCTHRVVWQ